MLRARPPLWVLAPAGLAALVRLAHLLFLAARDPLFGEPVVDAWFHAHEALQILDKGWLLPGEGAFYKGPLWTFVFAVSFSFFGVSGGVIALRLLNVALGVAAVWLIARLAERLGGPRAAWIGGIAAALYGTAVYFDASLLQPPLLSVLLLGSAARLLTARGRGRPDGALIGAGGLLGLLTITRAEGLAAAALAACWAAWTARRGVWPLRSPARAAGLVLAPALLVVAPVSVRNAALERDPVLVSWNGGINLFMGNDPAFEQVSGNWHPDLAWMRLYDAPAQLGLTRGADHQRFFVAQALRAAATHPGRTVALLAAKTALLFSGYEISNNQRIYDARGKSPLLSALLWRVGRLAVPFGVAGPLIAAGLVLAGRRGAWAAGPLLCLALATAAAPILFFNTARYRLPAVLLLLPAAAAGWSGAAPSSWRRSRIWAPLTALGVAALAAATVPGRATLPPGDALNLADVAEREGRWDEALAWRREAVRVEPDDPLARIRLADTLRGQGAPATALEHYTTVAARLDLAADWVNAAVRSAARAQHALGNYDEAAALYRRFLAANPDRPMTGDRPDFHLRGVPPLVACGIRIELAQTLVAAGQPAEAVAEASRVLVDCAPSGMLVRRAQRALERGAGAAPRVAPQGR